MGDPSSSKNGELRSVRKSTKKKRRREGYCLSEGTWGHRISKDLTTEKRGKWGSTNINEV